jgi:hypothetical protein
MVFSLSTRPFVIEISATHMPTETTAIETRVPKLNPFKCPPHYPLFK